MVHSSHPDWDDEGQSSGSDLTDDEVCEETSVKLDIDLGFWGLIVMVAILFFLICNIIQ
tara:strand:- start:820 stop:996 length:177 start_codon:yes stop_codon:yes gene_type:complete